MILFKYGTWTDQYTKDNIRHSAVFMAQAKVFNDPLDCLPSFDKNISIEDAQRSFLFQLEYGMGLPREYSRLAAQKMAEHVLTNQEWLDEIAAEVTPRWQEEIGVCCFTTNPKNPVMWGNYADKHRGICLCYDFPEEGDILTLPSGKTCYGPIRAFPMEYSDKRPRPKLLHTPGEYAELVRSMWTKSKEWEYEQEWRVTTTKYTGIAYYGPDVLKGIILGCKMPQEHIREVEKLVEELQAKPLLLQAKLKEDGYGIDIVPMECSWDELLTDRKVSL